MTQVPFTMWKHDEFVKYDDNTEGDDRMILRMVTQEPFTMWKHKSSGENQLGDYDYYLYDDPR